MNELIEVVRISKTKWYIKVKDKYDNSLTDGKWCLEWIELTLGRITDKSQAYKQIESITIIENVKRNQDFSSESCFWNFGIRSCFPLSEEMRISRRLHS